MVHWCSAMDWYCFSDSIDPYMHLVSLLCKPVSIIPTCSFFVYQWHEQHLKVLALVLQWYEPFDVLLWENFSLEWAIVMAETCLYNSVWIGDHFVWCISTPIVTSQYCMVHVINLFRLLLNTESEFHLKYIVFSVVYIIILLHTYALYVAMQLYLADCLENYFHYRISTINKNK